MRALIVAAFLVAAATPAPASDTAVDPPSAAATAQSKAAHLDALFAELKSAPTVEAGKAVENEIWAEWLKSGDAQTDAMMTEAVASMNVGELPHAMGLLNDIIARNPNYAEGWNKRATIHYMINAYDKSLADIEQTLKLEPRHFGALSGLGMIMIELGDKRRALAAFERAYAVDPVINNGKVVIERLKDAIGKDI